MVIAWGGKVSVGTGWISDRGLRIVFEYIEVLGATIDPVLTTKVTEVDEVADQEPKAVTASQGITKVWE